MENTEQFFRENVSREMEKQGYSQKELARMVGCTHEHLNAVLKGRTKPSYNLMEKLSNALNKEITDLMGGVVMGSEIPATYGANHIVTWVPFLQVKDEEEKKLFRASPVQAPIAFRTDWLYQVGSPDQMVFIRTMGESLEGEIPDNSLVLVDRSQTAPVNGKPYFMRIEKEMFIKKILKEAEHLVASADTNGSKGRVALENEGDWQIVGRCVWYSKTLL